MKKLTFTLTIVIISIVGILAQAPQSFNYQAVVRNSNGEIISDQLISIKASILQDSESGTVAYSEIHNDSTNQFGLIVLEIGQGNVETGVFNEIKWEINNFFLKLEMDETGGSNFQLMGTSQFLTVPYSLHTSTSERFLNLSSAQRDTMTNIPTGYKFLNTTTNTINYFNGIHWVELIGNCIPAPTQADAGPDQDSICIPATLAANSPQYGNGVWSIVNGTGGSFADMTNPASEFTGMPAIAYTLRWTITNICGYTEDDVNISFMASTTIANAGPDQSDVCSPTTLAANSPGNGTGLWTIINGIGGNIADPSDPASSFTGLADSSYTLSWTITTVCGTSNDEVYISFEAPPSIADAGPDQLNVISPITLAGNTPVMGTGQWTIISGTGGVISEPLNPASSFSGIVDSSYTLGWTISAICNSSFDDVIISFAGGISCPPTLTDIDGNIYNTVLIGDQCWMKENLKTTKYQNDTSIPNVTDENSWEILLTGAYVWFDNDINWKDMYGALYNWYAVDDPNGLCPTGWHVSTLGEWIALTDFIGGTSPPHGNELKSCRQVNSPQGGGCNTTEHPRWNESSANGTDNYGFSGLPGGLRDYNGLFNYFISDIGNWWSSTDDLYGYAYYNYMTLNDGYVFQGGSNKRSGYSVRCLKDY